MKKTNRYGVLLALVLFLLPAISRGNPQQYTPSEPSLFLYIKDFSHLEENAQASGLLTLDSQSREYLIAYLAQRYRTFGLYQQFRELPPDHILKTWLEDIVLVKMPDYAPVAILTVKDKYTLASHIMQTLQSYTAFQNILLSAFKQRYHVSFQWNAILISQSKAALEAYLNAPKGQIADDVLREQVHAGGDLIFYTRGETLVHPFLDALVLGSRQEKRLALGVQFDAKTCSISVNSTHSSEQISRRSLEFGWHIPQHPIFFLDSAHNPSVFLARFFGAANIAEYEQAFRKTFSDQFSFALLDISAEDEPSFVWVIQAKDGRHDDAEPTLARFLADVVGEDLRVAKFEENTLLPVKQGQESGLMHYTIAGFQMITDDKDLLNNSLKILTGRAPSIWDNPDIMALKTIENTPTVFLLDFTRLADRIARSSTWARLLDAAYFQQQDMTNFLNALGDLGVLTGYRETTTQYTQYHLELKQARN